MKKANRPNRFIKPVRSKLRSEVKSLLGDMKHIPFEAGKYYHVFNRGNNKENLFIEKRNYRFFLKRLRFYLFPSVRILSYCLMPNHFHLVIQIMEISSLPSDYQSGKRRLHQPFSNLFNSYSKAFNKAYNRTGSLFQEHLHRNEITDETYLKDVILYTHLNPENHGLTNDFKKFPFSSFSEILSTKGTLLCRDEVLEWFDGKDNFVFCHQNKKFRNQQKLDEIEELDY